MQWIISFAVVHYYLIYVVLVVLACAEGPYLSMIMGVLIRLGYFGFFPVYFALMAGDLIGDVIWYYIGRLYGHRFIARYGKYFSISEKGVDKVTRIFHKYKDRILFISKISNGFGFSLVTLMTAGMIEVPFWRYIMINLAGQFIWTGILLSVGIFLGHAYVTVNGIIGKISIVAVAVIVFLAFHGYRKYLTRRAEEMDII